MASDAEFTSELIRSHAEDQVEASYDDIFAETLRLLEAGADEVEAEVHDSVEEVYYIL